MSENPYALKQSSDYTDEIYTCVNLRDAWNEGYNQAIEDAYIFIWCMADDNIRFGSWFEPLLKGVKALRKKVSE